MRRIVLVAIVWMLAAFTCGVEVEEPMPGVPHGVQVATLTPWNTATPTR